MLTLFLLYLAGSGKLAGIVSAAAGYATGSFTPSTTSSGTGGTGNTGGLSGTIGTSSPTPQQPDLGDLIPIIGGMAGSGSVLP